MIDHPEDAVDEPMTGAQASYLRTLCEEAGVEFDPSLTKAAASERIDQLKAAVPRLAGTQGPAATGLTRVRR